MAFAFSAQNSWGFLMDFSHSCWSFAPEEIFAVLGRYFSLNGKLFSDILVILLLVILLGTFEFREYKAMYGFGKKNRSDLGCF